MMIFAKFINRYIYLRTKKVSTERGALAIAWNENLFTQTANTIDGFAEKKVFESTII